jgi:hypothetical protein
MEDIFSYIQKVQLYITQNFFKYLYALSSSTLERLKTENIKTASQDLGTIITKMENDDEFNDDEYFLDEDSYAAAAVYDGNVGLPVPQRRNGGLPGNGGLPATPRLPATPIGTPGTPIGTPRRPPTHARGTPIGTPIGTPTHARGTPTNATRTRSPEVVGKPTQGSTPGLNQTMIAFGRYNDENNDGQLNVTNPIVDDRPLDVRPLNRRLFHD